MLNKVLDLNGKPKESKKVRSVRSAREEAQTLLELASHVKSEYTCDDVRHLHLRGFDLFSELLVLAGSASFPP